MNAAEEVERRIYGWETEIQRAMPPLVILFELMKFFLRIERA